MDWVMVTVGAGVAALALMPHASPEQSVVAAAGMERQPMPWQAGAARARLRLEVGVGWRMSLRERGRRRMVGWVWWW